MHMLTARKGTGLWDRLRAEGRILEQDEACRFGAPSGYIDPRAATNIIPKNMSRYQLFTGYFDLLKRVYDWDNFAERTIKMLIQSVKLLINNLDILFQEKNQVEIPDSTIHQVRFHEFDVLSGGILEGSGELDLCRTPSEIDYGLSQAHVKVVVIFGIKIDLSLVGDFNIGNRADPGIRSDGVYFNRKTRVPVDFCKIRS